MTFCFSSPLVFFRRSLTIATLMLVSSALTPAHAVSPNELKGVKSEITRQQKSLSSQQNELDKLQKSLKQQELGISRLETQIKQTKASLVTANANIAKLKEKITQLEAQKTAQSDKLAQLLQTYYMMNKSNGSNLLRSDPEEDRMSKYFQHLAKARAETIEALEITQQELNDSERQLELEKEQITSLLKEQTDKRDELAQTQSKRKQTVNKIKGNISSNKVYLAELQRNETRLKAEIAKAAKRNAVPMDGLGRQKGRLPWPLNGRVLHSYGSHQTGQINWKGMVIGASYGQAVKAVYPGTVVFAEYLRGYGLVVLLDHGKGDMTLYGFNQTLLKKEGDKVTAGETIALAGDTGGQSQPGLYFEIRRNSKTQNPSSWLK